MSKLKTGEWIMPQNSRRRFFWELFVKLIRNPKLMFHIINPRRIKNFFRVYRKEGMKGVLYHYQIIEEVEKADLYPLETNQYRIDPVSPYNEAGILKQAEDYTKIVFEPCENPKVSILIPAYNQFEYTYNCLAAVKRCAGDIPYEIILADDASTDITRHIGEIVEGIRIIRNEQNLRFLKNCNQASRYARGKYILFLNNDTQVQDNWLAPMVELMEKDAAVGLVGSKLIFSDGWLQEAGGILWKDASACNYGYRQNPDSPEFNYVKEADYVTGASMMIRRALWEKTGGFDERFAPAYYEDVDLAFEVRRQGYRVVYQPLSVVVHFEGVSNGTDLSQGQKAYQTVNRQKFYDKWKAVLQEEHFENGENRYLAKDRGKFRRQLLYIDQCVPRYDKDAGGKCTYMYLSLFVKMGYKVTFIGDNYFKYEPYTTKLNQMGIEVLYGNYYRHNWQSWLKENLQYFEYVYLERPQVAVKYIDLVKQYSHAKLFYFDCDLHHVREYREYELTHNEDKRKSAEEWKKIEYQLFEKADVAHVVGFYEQQLMQKAFPEKPIRNIPLYIYDDSFPEVNRDFRRRKDIIFVGGFGHPPNIDAVQWFAQKIFPKILDRHPDMKWHIVGGSVPTEINELADEHILVEGFLTEEALQQLYRNCRMAVGPLRVGAGVKGKVVEAAYYQIPLVTTSIGAEGLDAEIGNMLVEDDADRMAETINHLYEDYDKLREMSEAGRSFIRKYFSLEEAQRVIELDFEK